VGNKERPMRMRFLLAFALAAVFTAAAQADIILGFDPSGLSTNFNVPVGQTVQVPLYLIERPGTLPDSGNILQNFGITGCGVRVDYTNSISGGATGNNATLFQPGWFSPVGYPILNTGNPAGGNMDIYGGTVGAAAFPSGNPPAVRYGTLTFTGNI